MNTCMFCGNELGRVPISYTFFIPKGDGEEPHSNSGQAHVNCIMEFERAYYDYEKMAHDLIARWENELAQ